MIYTAQLNKDTQNSLLSIWQFSSDAELLDATAFGDLFVKTAGKVFYLSVTDGKCENVSELIEEFGLPPVSINLGDEWYQLSAQQSIKEEKGSTLHLKENYCLAFLEPVFLEGEYSTNNINSMEITAYHKSVKAILERNRQFPFSTKY